MTYDIEEIKGVSISFVRGQEGGYINDPDDTGGETFNGITRYYQKDWQGWPLIDEIKKNNKVASDAEMTTLIRSSNELLELVNAFYYKYWYNSVERYALPASPILIQYFALCFVAGGKSGVRALQTAISNLFHTNLKADGILGGKTQQAMNKVFLGGSSLGELAVMAGFTIAELNRYVDSVRRRSVNVKFLVGWRNRAMSAYALALQSYDNARK